MAQLAITPPGAGSDRWRDQLAAWSAASSPWDEAWTTFLKGRVRLHLRGTDEAAAPLDDLAHDALTQAVEVVWDAPSKAA